MVKFNDKRPETERTNQLFFAVFEWRDPFMQEIRLVSSPRHFYPHWNWSVHISVCNTTLPTSKQIVTANPWSSVAILCGVFMALFKAANFAKLTIQWIIRMRKRHLRNKARELKQVTWEALQKDTDDTICSRSKSSKWWIWGLFLCFLRSLIAPFYNLWEALSTLRIVYP